MRLRVNLEVSVLAVFVSLAACSPMPERAEGGGEPDTTVAADTSDADVAALRQRLDSLNTAVEVAVGEARADDAAQCRAIGYGAKPCGGPWRFLVYSTASTDPAALERMVGEYNETQASLNELLGLASDCSAVLEPDVALENGRCGPNTPR